MFTSKLINFFFQFQTVVLGLLVASGAFADVIHHKSGKQCHKKVTQKANNNGTLESSITNHSNVTNSHPSVFSSGEKSSGVSSTPAPFEDGTLPTPAPSVSKSLQQSTPPPFVISDLSSNSISSLKSTQPTPVPFQFSSLFSTPAPLAYSEKSIAPEDPFKSIVAFYSHSIPAPFTLNSSSLVSPAVSIKSYGTFGSQPIPAPFEYNVSSSTPAQFEHSTLSATPEDLFKSIIASYSQSISAPFSIESQSTAVPFTFSGSSSSPAVAGSIESFNTVGSHPIPTTYSYSQGNAFTQYGGHSASSPAHTITINREVPVPYYVQIEKRIPYPVVVHVPHPYQVTVEKHIPYPVRVQVDRGVPVPSPYPVEVEKRVPYPVEKPVPYEVRVPVDRPYPVNVPYEKPVPYAVEKPVLYPVQVNVDRPYPVEKPVPYPVAVERPVPYAVEKPVPYPVEKPVPYPVEKKIPYPVKYEVPIKVPVPVQVKVPVNVDRPVPYPVEKPVPYPVAVPYEVKVPVPVRSPAQRFATVHYYQQSPIVVQPEWYKSYTSGSTATPVTDNHIVQSSFVSVSGQTGSDYAGSDYSKSNYAGSGIVKDSDSYGFDQQSFYGSTTPVPSSPQYKSSNFDSVNQQVYSAGGSATADSQQTEHLEVGKK